MEWWHRLAVKGTEYCIQGWKREKVYPDFLVKLETGKDGMERLYFIESKGDQLEGNKDTDYKQKLFNAINAALIRLTAQEGSLDLLPLMPTKLMAFIDHGNAEMATITAQIGYIRNTWRERTHEPDATKQGQYGLEIKRKLEVVSAAYSNLDNIFRDGLVEADVHRANVLSRISNEVIAF